MRPCTHPSIAWHQWTDGDARLGVTTIDPVVRLPEGCVLRERQLRTRGVEDWIVVMEMHAALESENGSHSR